MRGVSGARDLVARLLGSLSACLALAVLVMLATASTAAAWTTDEPAPRAAADTTIATVAVERLGTAHADTPRLCRDVPDSCPTLGPSSPPEPEPEDDDAASEVSTPAPAPCGDAVVPLPSCTHVDLHRMCISTGLGRGPPTRDR